MHPPPPYRPRPLRVLQVEDSAEDAFLILRTLKQAGFDPVAERVESVTELVAQLEAKDWDILLVDEHLPSFSGTQVTTLLKERDCDLPVILVTGTITEDQAVRMLELGVADFVLKNNLTRLPSSVERALREAEAQRLLRLQTAALHATAHAIMLTNAHGIIEWINPAFSALTGYAPEEVIGRTPSILRSGQHEPDFYKEMWSAILTGEVWQGEMINRRKDGTLFVEDTTITPVRGARGKITHFIAVKQDASERVKAAEDLRRSERKYRQLFEHLTDAAFLVEMPERKIIDGNPAAEDLTGRKLSRLIGLPISDLHPPGQETCRCDLRHHRERVHSEDCHGELIDASGRRTPVAISSTPLSIDGREILLVLMRDISERKRAEAELRITNERYARQEEALIALTHNAAVDEVPEFIRKITEVASDVLQVSRVSIWWYQRDKTAIVCGDLYNQSDDEHSSGTILREADNPEYFQALRVTQVITAHDAHNDPRTAAFAPGYLGPLGIGAMLDATVQAQGDTCGVLCCEHVGPARRWTPDEQTFAVAVANLISLVKTQEERKNVEAQLLRAQRMESVGTLAAGLAHDLNNILSPILMSVPLLRLHPDEGNRESIISTIEVSAERGAQIVKQVLTFGRGLSGEKHPLNLGTLIKEQLKIVRETFPKNIATEYSWAEEVWPVVADATQIHQVLLNLFLNARDAMPSGGRLTIATSNVTVDASFASMVPDVRPGEYVLMEVADSGTGMPKEVVDRIFEPFFTTKGIGRGTGLGLSTVIGIVKEHGGFIHVDSRIGTGTTFRVYLPRSTEDLEDVHEEQRSAIPRGNGELVLVVDDEPAIRTAVEASLQSHGYTVLAAEDGTDALSKYAMNADEIALVLTDILMPVMDGLALVRVLKKMASNLPIIASSGIGDPAQLAELKSAGVEIVLRKPYGASVLLRAVSSAIQAH